MGGTLIRRKKSAEEDLRKKRGHTFILIFEAFLSFSHMKKLSTSSTAFLMLPLEVFKARSMRAKSASLLFILISWPTSTVSPANICRKLFSHSYRHIVICVILICDKWIFEKWWREKIEDKMGGDEISENQIGRVEQNWVELSRVKQSNVE